MKGVSAHQLLGIDLVAVGNSYMEQVVQLDLYGADLPVRDVLLELERMEVKYLD